MAIKNIEQQFKQTNIGFNRFHDCKQVSLKPITNPLSLTFYKINSYFEATAACLVLFEFLLFVAQIYLFITHQLKLPIVAISVIIVSLIIINILIDESLSNHLTKYKMKYYKIDSECAKNQSRDLNTKFLTKEQIDQLWQHGYDLLVAYKKANYNLKALPQEWQWLVKKHYELVYDTYHLIIAKNDLMIADIKYFDNSIDKLKLWDVKHEQKVGQGFSGKIITAFILTVVAIITLIIGRSSAILLFLSTISSFFAAVCIWYSSEFDDEQLDNYYEELHKNNITVPEKPHLVIDYFANSKRI